MQTKANFDDIHTSRPIDTLVHLGAGRCCELEAYLALQPQRLLLVEADPQLAEALQGRVADQPQVQVRCAAVAGQPGPATFFRYNLPEAGSLHAASGLLQLFPGLKTVGQLQVEAVSPVVLLQPLQLQVGQENRLVIDLPGEELPVLQTLQQAQLLHLFRQLQLRCGREALYAGGEPAACILQWLKEEGFDLVAEDDSQDPDRPHWTLQRNALHLRNLDLQRQMEALIAQLEQSTGSNEDQAKQVTGLQAEVQRLTQERDAQAKLVAERQQAIEQLTKMRDEQEKVAAERLQQLEQLTKERDEKAKWASDLKAQLAQTIQARDEAAKLVGVRQQQITELTKAKEESSKQGAELQLQIQQLLQERDSQAKLAGERQALLDKLAADNTQHVTEISELLKNQQERLIKMEQGLKSQFNKGLENSTKQLESLIGIQTYLTRGQLIPAMHGWPVSADFAYYLINLIEENNYDLIVEFGSGSSTVLMASATLKQMQRQAIRKFQLADDTDKVSRQITCRGEFEDAIHLIVPAVMERVLPSLADVPPRIITFEHHRQYYEETLTKLRQAGVADLVELRHAPLRDHVTWEGEHFLYYACEERIAALANLLNGSKARILVLVDGPPAATGKHARYPALPILLQYLATHRLDILLDDFNRQDEKEIVERWIELLNKRNQEHEHVSLGFKKGACLLAIK